MRASRNFSLGRVPTVSAARPQPHVAQLLVVARRHTRAPRAIRRGPSVALKGSERPSSRSETVNRIAAAVLASLVVLAIAVPAAADPTAQFWDELGGSASSDGLSAAITGVPTGNRQASVVLGPDGRPVVAYADGDTIHVRRWTGTDWELIGPRRTSGGLPQIVTDAAAGCTWPGPVRRRDGHLGNLLLARDWNGSTWDELGGSGSGGGITVPRGPRGCRCSRWRSVPTARPISPTRARRSRRRLHDADRRLHAWTNQIFVRR